MILTGNEIIRQVQLGNITISPFSASQVNPNSYNYRLGEYCTEVHPQTSLGRGVPCEQLVEIPKTGLRLEPGRVYLSHTLETIGSRKFVPSLIGRSSVGRMGLFLQLAADLGNLGAAHRWTLELTCVQPIIVYPTMIIGQVSFWVPVGDIVEYTGQYTDFSLPKNSVYNSRMG